MTSKRYSIFSNNPPIEGGLYGDLFNASPTILPQPLFDSNKPEKDRLAIENEIRRRVQAIKTIREYVRILFDQLGESTRSKLDFEQVLAQYLQPLEPRKACRFDEIVIQIRETVDQFRIDIGKLKLLVAEQYALIFTASDIRYSQFVNNLGLKQIGEPESIEN